MIKKRIDGIYFCPHKPWIPMGEHRVLCEDCPAMLRPSDLTMHEIIRVVNLTSYKIAIDADRDSFIVEKPIYVR